MSREEMFNLVSSLLRNTPEREAVEVTAKTNPFDDLGMDSLDGIVFACIFSERLGIEISPDDNPLVNDKKRRPRVVDEIVEWGLSVLQNHEEDQQGEVNRG